MACTITRKDRDHQNHRNKAAETNVTTKTTETEERCMTLVTRSQTIFLQFMTT